MQGVTKFFPAGDASVESLIAGNDMLCLPGDIPVSITKVKTAISNKRLKWKEIDDACKKSAACKISNTDWQISDLSILQILPKI